MYKILITSHCAYYSKVLQMNSLYHQPHSNAWSAYQICMADLKWIYILVANPTNITLGSQTEICRSSDKMDDLKR